MTEARVADLAGRRVHPPYRPLSDRELEVMRLLALGKTVAEIASLLALSVGTIRTYRGRLLHKLAMKNASDRACQTSLLRKDMHSANCW